MSSSLGSIQERIRGICVKYWKNATLKYRTRNARIKFWWTRAAPVAFCMGAGAEYWKWTHQENYRQFRLEGGQSLRPSAYERETYRHYLEKHGTQVMETEPDADTQFLIDTIIKENVEQYSK